MRSMSTCMPLQDRTGPSTAGPAHQLPVNLNYGTYDYPSSRGFSVLITAYSYHDNDACSCSCRVARQAVLQPLFAMML